MPYVVLHGIVRGDCIRDQRVELGPTARVIGNVYYNLIEMAIGAEINGKLVHQPEGQVPLLEQTSSNRRVGRVAKTTGKDMQTETPVIGTLRRHRRIVFTDAAASKVGELIQEEDNPELKLRVFISGGGCSGFQYGFTFDENSRGWRQPG